MENVCFLSEKSGEQKVVQLYVDNVPYLVLHDKLRHGKILDNFLKELGICFQRGFNYQGNFHAKLCGEDYSVVGMSRAEVSDSGLYFFGKSLGFNIGLSLSHLENIRNYTNLELNF